MSQCDVTTNVNCLNNFIQGDTCGPMSSKQVDYYNTRFGDEQLVEKTPKEKHYEVIISDKEIHHMKRNYTIQFIPITLNFIHGR